MVIEKAQALCVILFLAQFIFPALIFHHLKFKPNAKKKKQPAKKVLHREPGRNPPLTDRNPLLFDPIVEDRMDEIFNDDDKQKSKS